MFCDYESGIANCKKFNPWLQVVFVLVTPFYWKREEMSVSLVVSALPIWLIEMFKQ